MGDDPSLKLTAAGVVEALSAKLFQLKDVYMASPALVEKVNPADPPEKIARSLGVKMIVQGTVQGNKDRISVVVSLDDIATHKRILSQEFHRRAPGSAHHPGPDVQQTGRRAGRQTLDR